MKSYIAVAALVAAVSAQDLSTQPACIVSLTYSLRDGLKANAGSAKLREQHVGFGSQSGLLELNRHRLSLRQSKLRPRRY